MLDHMGFPIIDETSWRKPPMLLITVRCHIGNHFYCINKKCECGCHER